MKIKTFVRVGTGIWIVLLATAAVLLYIIRDEFTHATDKHLAMREIKAAVFDLTLLSSEYVLYKKERALGQWQERSGFLRNELVRSQERWGSEDRGLTDLLALQQRLEQTFGRLREVLAGGDGQDLPRPISDLRTRNLVAQVLNRALQMDAKANAMAHEGEIRLQRAAEHLVLVIITVGFAIALTVGVTGMLFGSSILTPLARLRLGVEAVTAGNLGHRIGLTSGNEIGEVAASFDAMTERLQAVTVSRDELEKEVRERQRAQDELRTANAALEEIIEVLKASRERAIHTEKLAALGTLTAGIAHELNNPMMGLINYIEYAQRQNLPGKAVDALQKALTQVNRMSGILNNMMNFARPSGAAVGAVELAELVKETLDLINVDLVGAGIEVEQAMPAGLPPARAGGADLQQVLLNLLLNARDALAGCADKRIIIEADTAGDRVTLRVRDSGPGVSAELQTRIFNPFFTTKAPGSGTGLGLSVSDSIVKKFGGTLSSVPRDDGACFEIELPIHRQEDA